MAFKPTKQHCQQVKKLALLGATMAQIADFFLITEAQLTKALENSDDFRQARAQGGLIADAQVAASLFKRACGYDVMEDKAFSYMGDVEIVKVRKHIPADMNAAKFWLKNRQREDWQEQPIPEHGGDREPWEIELTG